MTKHYERVFNLTSNLMRNCVKFQLGLYVTLVCNFRLAEITVEIVVGSCAQNDAGFAVL